MKDLQATATKCIKMLEDKVEESLAILQEILLTAHPSTSIATVTIITKTVSRVRASWVR